MRAKPSRTAGPSGRRRAAAGPFDTGPGPALRARRAKRAEMSRIPDFAKIQKAAEQRLGKAGLARRLPKVKSAAALRKVTDDRYLSLMSLRIFRAGLRHDMVD